ncbi:MAG: hypothetical protein M3Y22_03790, partial [Pseudomonadota bacterium]|nr:hypothetical protein [Pseudomonadota bacterium]
ALLHDVEDAFARIDLLPPFARLREAMHRFAEAAETLDSPTLLSHLEASGLAAEVAEALANFPNRLPDCTRSDAMPAEAEAHWWHIHGLFSQGHLSEEAQAAGRDLAAGRSVDQRRVVALKRAGLALLAADPADGPDD